MLIINDDGTMTIVCNYCGHGYKMPYDPDIEKAYTHGVRGLIQNVFPEMPAEVREMFITGDCGLCYDGQIGYFRWTSKKVNDFVAQRCNDIIVSFGLSDVFYTPMSAQDLWTSLKEYEEYDGIANDRIDEFIEAMRQVLREATKMIEDEEEEE